MRLLACRADPPLGRRARAARRPRCPRGKEDALPRTNRHWLPAYLDPDALLPKIPETQALFSRRPFLVQDFVGKAISFLRSEHPW